MSLPELQTLPPWCPSGGQGMSCCDTLLNHWSNRSATGSDQWKQRSGWSKARKPWRHIPIPWHAGTAGTLRTSPRYHREKTTQEPNFQVLVLCYLYFLIHLSKTGTFITIPVSIVSFSISLWPFLVSPTSSAFLRELFFLSLTLEKRTRTDEIRKTK